MLNPGCPDFGVKGGGDSGDQIRDPLDDVSFQRFIIIHCLMRHQMIGSVLDITYSFFETRVSELGTRYASLEFR
jgi:hypothetical protein